MSGIIAIATAITQLIPVFTKLVSLYVEARRKGWVSDGRDLATKINEAKTDEERKHLARLLFERTN